MDFGYFGPPEEHYKWTKEKREGTYVNADDPSSEVGGEIAAALAAASVALRQTDPAYADTLVLAAKMVRRTPKLPTASGSCLGTSPVCILVRTWGYQHCQQYCN